MRRRPLGSGSLPEPAQAPRMPVVARDGTLPPPSEPTIRRILSKADPVGLDRVLSQYVVAHSSGRAIAIDGKTIRSSSVGLMAVLVHKDGTVVAQKRLDGPKGHEIPAAPQLLEPLDLSGKVVTARRPPYPECPDLPDPGKGRR